MKRGSKSTRRLTKSNIRKFKKKVKTTRGTVGSKNSGNLVTLSSNTSQSKMIKISKSSMIMININEFKKICLDIGVDPKEESPFIVGLIKSFLNSGLDPLWKREEDEEGRIVYFFEPNNMSSYTHPHISRLKSALIGLFELNDQKLAEKNLEVAKNLIKRIDKIIEDERQEEIQKIMQENQAKKKKKKKKKGKKKKGAKSKKATLDKKKSQTLPTEEPKESKVVTETTPLIVDDTNTDLKKGLYIANDSLENEFEMEPVDPLNNDSKIDLRIIDSRGVKMIEEKKEEKTVEQTEADQFATQEVFYQYSNHYYTQKYGFPLVPIPEEILQSKTFQEIPTQRAFQLFYQMGIQPNEGYLFNHTLLLEALEVPPGILVDESGDHIKYKFKGKWIDKVYHPSLFYVRNNIEYLKKKKSKELRGKVTKRDKFVFIDELGRKFETDLQDLYKKWLSFPTMRKLLQYSTYEVDKDLFKGNDLHKLKKDYDKKLREIMEKNYGVDNKEKNISSNVSDYHMLELISQLKIDLKKNIHLLFPIEEFIKEKEEIGEWAFRIKPDGTKYWINHHDMIVTFEYPYLAGLKARINHFREQLREDKKKCILKEMDILYFLIKDKEAGEGVIDACKKRTFKLMESYLHSISSTSKKQAKSLKNSLNAVRKRLNKVLIVKLSMEDFINLVFFCKFDLEAYVLKNRADFYWRKEKMFLQDANPDLELLNKFRVSKHKQQKKQHRKSMFKLVTSSFGGSSKKVGRRSLSNSLAVSIKNRLLMKRYSEFQKNSKDLGPLEDYMHLIDPILRKKKEESEVNEGLVLGQKLLDSINNLSQFDEIMKDCQELIKASNADEAHLNHLIEKIKKIYQRLEREEKDIAGERLLALKDLKDKAVLKRNKIRKNELMFKRGVSNLIDDAIKKGVKKVSREGGERKGSFEKETDTLAIKEDLKGRRASSIITPAGYSNSDSKIRSGGLFKSRNNLGNEEARFGSDKSSSQRHPGVSPNAFNAFVDDESDSDNQTTLITDRSDMLTIKIEPDMDKAEIRKRSITIKKEIIKKLHYRMSLGSLSGPQISMTDLNVIASSDPKAFREMIKNNTLLTEEEKDTMLKQYDVVEEIQSEDRGKITINLPKHELVKHLKGEDIEELKEMGLLDHGVFTVDELKELQIGGSSSSQIKQKIIERSKNPIGLGIGKFNSRGNVSSLKGDFALDASSGFIKKSNNGSPLKNPNLPPVSLSLFQKNQESGKINIGNSSNFDTNLIRNFNKKIQDRIINTKIQNLNKNEKTDNKEFFDNMFSEGGETEDDDRDTFDLDNKDVHDLEALVNKTEFMKSGDMKKYKDFLRQKNEEMMKKEESSNKLVIKGKGQKIEQSDSVQIPKMDIQRWFRVTTPNLDLAQNDSEPVELVIKNLFSMVSFDEGQVEAQPMFPKIFQNPSGNLAYARTNNNVPIKLTKDNVLRTKIQLFILGWLSKKFKFPKEKIDLLFKDDTKRSMFFDTKAGYFDFVLSLILKNPKLCKRAINYVFDKDKNRDEFESSKRAKEIKVLKMQYSHRKELMQKKKSENRTRASRIKIGKAQLGLLNSGKNFNLDNLSKKRRGKGTRGDKKMYKSHDQRKLKKIPFDHRIKLTDEYIVKNPNSFIQDLIKFYGRPSELSRKMLLEFDREDKLELSIIPVLNDIAYWMGIKAIKSSKNGNEGDLVWIPIFMLHHHKQTRSVGGSISSIKDQKWIQEMPYFKCLLLIQREKKRNFKLVRMGKDLEESLKAISWFKFWDKRLKCNIWYNFYDGSKTAKMSKRDKELYRRAYNYQR